MIRAGIGILAVLALGAGSKEDPFIRGLLQGKYDVRSSAAASGKSPFDGNLSSRYRWIELDKKATDLSTLKSRWKAVQREQFQQKVKVDSADALDDKCKAAITVAEHEVRREGGKLVSYDRAYTAQDTWIRADVDWLLIETRVTRISIRRNGKLQLSASEKVKTDFERQYGRLRSSTSGRG